jgi:hypothetical protein
MTKIRKIESLKGEKVLKKGSDKLLKDFMLLEKEDVQNVFGGLSRPVQTCHTIPGRCLDNASGVPNSGEICGPDPDFANDVADIEEEDPDTLIACSMAKAIVKW